MIEVSPQPYALLIVRGNDLILSFKVENGTRIHFYANYLRYWPETQSTTPN
jgi:hypothetical protein